MLTHIKPDDVLAFRASKETHAYFYNLLTKEKEGSATQEEKELINSFMQVEPIIRLAKVPAKQYAHH